VPKADSKFDKIDGFDVIGARVLAELNRRLGSPGDAADLPGTLLMTLAQNYLKYLERQEAAEASKEAEHVTSALEMIDKEGLSVARKVEILTDFIDQVETEWREASARLVELLKEVEVDGDSETVS
jgi:hypothetical protein